MYDSSCWKDEPKLPVMAVSDNSHILESEKEEWALGSGIAHDLKVSAYCQTAYNKANKLLGMINRAVFRAKKK